MHEQLEEELAAQIARQLAEGDAGDPVALLTGGIRSFLDHCTEPVARIVLVDAPSVLGWELWREIDEKHGLGLVMAGLQGAMDAGALREQPVRPLAHLMLGALGEAGMLIAHSDDPKGTRAEVEAPLIALLEGLRIAGGGVSAHRLKLLDM